MGCSTALSGSDVWGEVGTPHPRRELAPGGRGSVYYHLRVTSGHVLVLY